jgi:hypothetical protein
MATGYCVSCGRGDSSKGKGKKMKNPEIKKTAKGGFMAQGNCETCNTRMSAMMSKDNAEKALKDGAKKSF